MVLTPFKIAAYTTAIGGGEFDMALRRVLRQTAITPSQFDENSSFTDMVNQLYDLHVGTVTKFP